MGYKKHFIDCSQNQQSQPLKRKKTSSQENARQYDYYRQMIKQFKRKLSSTGQLMALGLILSRGSKPTNSLENRGLALLDVDKLLSFNLQTIKQNDSKMINMRMAVDLSGVRMPNPLTNQQQPETGENAINPSTGNRNAFQMLRLVRAAQMHYIATQRTARNQTMATTQFDAVNTSFMEQN